MSGCSKVCAAAREWMTKHVVDFRRGYELANLDILGPVAWLNDHEEKVEGP